MLTQRDSQSSTLFAKRILVLVILLAAIVPVRAERAVASLVPLPQEVTFAQRRLTLDGAPGIYCEEKSSALLASGIEHLEGVFAGLGVAAPVRLDSLDQASAASSLRIVVGSVAGSPTVRKLAKQLDLNLTEENPGPQGYVIQVVDSQTVLLGGSDEAGAMYALVTLGQLIGRNPGGEPFLEVASIRDWPDFHKRLLTQLRWRSDDFARHPGAEGFLEVTKRQVDFCLAYKINGISMRWFTLPWSGTALRSDVEKVSKDERAVLRELTDYGRARGIFFEMHGYSAVERWRGEFPKLDLMRTHGVGYSWSEDKLLHRSARYMAEFARDVGIGVYYLHAPDRTKASDFGGFLSRGEKDRARWDDDQRAAADAHVMQVFYDEIKALNPDITICAVLVPYGASVDRLDSELRERVLDYWTQCNALLPNDMMICVRENRRQNVEKFKQVFKDHPIFFYIEPVASKTMAPFMATTQRMARTFDFDDPRDLYYNDSIPECARLSEVMQAQFCWNSDAPGWEWHRSYNFNPFQDVKEPVEVAVDLVNAALVRMLGVEAGMAVAEASRLPVAWNLIAEPEETLYRTQRKLAGKDTDIPGWDSVELGDFSQTAALLQQHAENAAAGVDVMLPVGKKLREGELVLSDWQRALFNDSLIYYASAQALGLASAARIGAKDALATGDVQQARLLIDAGLEAADKKRRELGLVENMTFERRLWPRQLRGVGKDVREEESNLRRLDEMLAGLERGVIVEMADRPEALEKAHFLVADKNGVRLGGEDAVFFEWAEAGGRGVHGPTMRLVPSDKKWKPGKVDFEPVDMRPYIQAGGYLRFYVNSEGDTGAQRFTFWLDLLQQDGKTKARNRPVWLYEPDAFSRNRLPDRAGGFVEIDELPMTWQLVSIPLSDLTYGDAAYVTGFSFNYARAADEAFLVADPYLIMPTEPVEAERPLVLR